VTNGATKEGGVIRFILLGAVAGAAAMAIATSSGADAGTGPAQIKITNTLVQSAFVNVGSAARGPGDQEIYAGRLYNRRITTKPIGRSEQQCTYSFSGVRNCRGTFTLPKGKLMVGGTLRYTELYQLAVLGGTGLYDNARGTVTVTRLGRRPTRELVVFRLTG
jgi:hypothetical protein